MVEGEVQFHLDRFSATGAELIKGEARFVAPKTVEVRLSEGSSRTITGERVFVDVGSRSTIPDIVGLAAAKPMTHVEALDLQRLPEHVIVLGGGYVGLELAQALRRFGSEVTVSSEAGKSPRLKIPTLRKQFWRTSPARASKYYLKRECGKWMAFPARRCESILRTAVDSKPSSAPICWLQREGLRTRKVSGSKPRESNSTRAAT